MRKLVIIALVVSVIALGGCLESEKTVAETQEAASISPPPISPNQSSLPSQQSTEKPKEVSLHISKQDFGKDWPFTVSEGVLARRETGISIGTTDMVEILFSTKGTTYAVNGTAKGSKKYADIRDIWADDPDLPGLKKNIGPIIDKGLSLGN